MAFDVLVDRGDDVRTLPLAHRKAGLKRLARGAQRWIALADGVPGHGRRLFEASRSKTSRELSPSGSWIPTRPGARPGGKSSTGPIRVKNGDRSCSSGPV